MIDLHTHILPGIDDGAKNAEQSIALIDLLLAQSVDEIALTPHFNPESTPMGEFLQKREAAFLRLQKELGDRKVALYPASETRYSHVLLNYTDLTPICIENTRHLLLELPFSSTFEKKMFTDIGRLVDEHGITPIIAHIDRYIPVHKDTSVIRMLRECGCKIQLNCDCLTGFFSRGFAMKLLKKGLIDVLGTDCHNTTTRVPVMREALNRITSQLGEDYVTILEQNAKEILEQ